MKVELNTSMCPIVIPDTYGTEFCYEVADDMVDDFKKLMIDTAEEYIKEALYDTVFEDSPIEMGAFNSPREYNFTTDWIDFTIDLSDDVVNEMKFVDNEFFEYAKKYGSRDGFISFYPIEPISYIHAMNGKGRTDLAVSMYIMWKVEQNMNIEDYQYQYIEDVREYAWSNGYMEDEYEDD